MVISKDKSFSTWQGQCVVQEQSILTKPSLCSLILTLEANTPHYYMDRNDLLGVRSNVQLFQRCLWLFDRIIKVYQRADFWALLPSAPGCKLLWIMIAALRLCHCSGTRSRYPENDIRIGLFCQAVWIAGYTQEREYKPLLLNILWLFTRTRRI